ncbi:hypothetical protein [Olleya sp. Bg11-27]|uniref:hypothetical protein n=1 Tax=Olleya sp. Bg11-27 TaxID=2058135 RepID=UPI000C300E56|nr:hypothetical protein [Olleya sp. Bg11-27]AUC75790.1 hypothetical protein CW732_08905 [Olleya sp. Bg11-27]
MIYEVIGLKYEDTLSQVIMVIIYGIGQIYRIQIKKKRIKPKNLVSGHVRLLKLGQGKTKSFKSGGWSFREAPKQ